ncbi:RNA polymerase, sigma-24 subunit, ECF subfamily [Rhodopirellula islandica]|uniref:RNA polymerase, sigma-24 subunit, ECF subfamily n=1 Tax=Rhodopirellula islandica TaxID=595434 RepID=A0A0J1EF59_RHOIS|nr:sigma-70 family RNA polymerase sigma factor [Rhodopirellula islandica]KLU04154.1 RNA polymerase, sigma-24 subunit, ECF subfamily [Rhodopirellula islandica]
MPSGNSTIEAAEPLPPPIEPDVRPVHSCDRPADNATAARWDDLHPTDADLLDAWVTDDCLEALDTLVRRYAQMVLSVCIRRCHDRTDADDAMQTTFLYLAQSAKKIRHPERLAGWLHRVAQRASIATMMSPERAHQDLSDVPSTPIDPLERLTLRHQAIVLDEELSELPEKYRSAIVLHLQQGVSVTDTAKRMGTTEGSVRGWIARGKQRLARQLRLRGVVPMAAWAAAQAWSVSETMAAQSAFELTRPPTTGSSCNSDSPPGADVGNSNWTGSTSTSNFSALESHLTQGIATMPVVTILGSTAAVGLALLVAFAVPAGDDETGRTASVLTFATADEDSPPVLAQFAQGTVAGNPNPPVPNAPPQGSAPSGIPAQLPVVSPAPATPYPPATPPTPPEPPKAASQVAKRVAETLDQPTTLSLESNIRSLPETLQRSIHIPVLLDSQGMTLGEVDMDSVHVQFDSQGDQPLRTLLRKALEPAGLKAVVDDDGLLITTDMTMLARRGISTDRWLDVTPEQAKTIDEVMGKEVSYNFLETPLEDAVRVISEDLNFPILIDKLTLEEIGLTNDTPVNLSVQSISCRSFLRLMLHPMGLTYQYKDEVLQITTQEAGGERLRQRLYFLEGTGLPRGGDPGTIEMITSTIQPDAWEALGGYSTISSVNHSREGRPALLVSTTDDLHKEIEDLMLALRETHTGEDPRLSDEEFEQQQKNRIQAIGGGMGGGGGGGMF